MGRLISLLTVLVVVASCGQPTPPSSTTTRTQKDPRVVAIEERIAKTTDEGKEIIEKVKGMKPEVNDVASAQSIAQIADDYALNRAGYNITPIGWEASQKGSKRWKINFHYQDYQKQFLVAEWEYNPETDKVYPFELKNAPQFWTSVATGEKPKAQ